MSLRITPRSQHHTPRAADSHLAIWSTKPGGPRVIQEAWKAAKWVPISKAVEQVEAWQQVFCSCWPSENTRKGVEEGGKCLKSTSTSSSTACLPHYAATPRFIHKKCIQRCQRGFFFPNIKIIGVSKFVHCLGIWTVSHTTQMRTAIDGLLNGSLWWVMLQGFPLLAHTARSCIALGFCTVILCYHGFSLK